VVTFHNLGRWLPECLASLAAQTVPIEIIVVDDGSEPAERALLDAEAARYPSVRVVRQEQRGPSAARNRGVAEAAHDLILMVDADNVMRPRLVERLREALRNRPDAAFACPAFRSFKDQGGATLLHYGPAEGCDDALLVRNVRGDTCALHTRAGLEKLGGFDARSPDCEDWRLWIHAADDGLSGVAVPEVLFDYRERADSRLRSTPAIETAHARLELLREHPRLLGRHASSVSLLAASALLAEAQHHRNLGRDDREGELQALTGAGATAHLEIERLGAELSRRKEQVALLEQRLVEAGQQLVAVDAKRSAAVAAREQGQLKIAELEESGVITTAALHEAEQAAAQAQAAAGEMAKSSAVAASRLLHRASPSLHGVVGRASRLVVRMLRRRG